MPTDTDTLVFLVNTLRKVAESQRALVAEWSAGTSPAAVDFARGSAAAFDKAADIVAAQLPSTSTEES